MNQVNVKKEQLLKILKENRAKHVSDYKEALEDYRAAYIEVLQKNIEIAQSGAEDMIPVDEINLPEPQCYAKSYDTAIGMLEISVDETVQLNEIQYRQYVNDEWGWSDSFKLSNSTYSSSFEFLSARGVRNSW